MVEIGNKPINSKIVIDFIVMLFFNSMSDDNISELYNYTLESLTTIYNTLVRNGMFSENLTEKECKELLKLVKVTYYGQSQEKIECYKKLAKKNNIVALYLLGDAYLYGMGVEQNILNSLEVFKRVLRHKKCDEATYLRIKIIKVLKNINCCFNGTEKFCIDGTNSQDEDVRVGCEYLKNKESSTDIKMAKKYLFRAVKRKNPDAMYFLGCMHQYYNYGIRVGHAIKLLTLAARYGNSKAFLELGNIYKNGVRIRPDYELAKDYYERAASKGIGCAQFALGSLYSSGLLAQSDYKRAIEMYIKAAKKNLINGDILTSRMRMMNGNIRLNPEEILDYINAEDPEISSRDMVLFGRMYLNGVYVERNYQKAKMYYEQAAAENEFSAFCDLGYMYLMRLGVETDYKKADIYFKCAQKVLSNSKRRK